MSVATTQPNNVRIVQILLILGGLGLIASALAYNELLLGAVDPNPPLRADTIAAVRWTQLGLLLAGLALVAGAAAIGRVPAARRRTVGPWLARGLAATLALLPFLVAEIALRPFTPLSRPMTTIFERDPSLGWRMRPGAEKPWGDVMVRVNGHGLRGPDVDYAKPSGQRRILFLGDSVTFGYGLPAAAQAFPARVAAILTDDADHPPIAINAGVGGYSPWQEQRFLESQGIRYSPDLVVVGFVLNDVTEKFGLRRFGGTGEGFQLEHSVFSLLDRLSIRSALFYQLRAAQRRLRFGSDVKAGAERRELLDVRALVETPERDDVARAWTLTLDSVRRIATFCAERDLPLLLAVFPYAFQFDDPAALTAPQRSLAAFASAESIPFIDLLPPLVARLEESARTPDAYFLDRNHLSAEGSEVVAELLAEEIRRRGWLASTPAR